MQEGIVTGSSWDASRKLLTTQISGQADMDDIVRWENSLIMALSQVPDNGIFKIFVNLHGFKAANFEAHKKFRNIIPLTLAKYGWTTGYVHLFEQESKSLVISNERGISCLAAAHCHQDETKIGLYENSFSSTNEHFFTEPEKAREWIEGIQINN